MTGRDDPDIATASRGGNTPCGAPLGAAPNSADAIESCCRRLCGMEERDDEALAQIQAAINTMTDPPVDTLIQYGALLRHYKRFEEAFTLYTKILDQDPRDPEARTGLWETYVRLGIADGAEFGSPEQFAEVRTQRYETKNGKSKYWFNCSPAENDKENFLVLTAGNCGSIWLAGSLNLHPDVFSTCGVDHPLEGLFAYNLNKDGTRLLKAAQPHHFRYGARPEYIQSIIDKHGLNLKPGVRQYHCRPWFLFEEIEALPYIDEYKIIGSIHAFGPKEFSRIYLRDQNVLKGRKVVVANLTRHPIPRLESWINAYVNFHVDNERAVLDVFLSRNREYWDGIAAQYGISLDNPRVRAVISAYHFQRAVYWLADEHRLFAKMETFRLEDLKENRQCFADAFSFLTDGKLTAGKDYLDKVFTTANLGSGRQTKNEKENAGPADANAQWGKWSEFERDQFIALCQKHKIHEHYHALGYDFSFIEQL